MSGLRFMADPTSLRTLIGLESLVAVFHAPSGATHLLAPPAPEILAALGAGPADADTVLLRLRQTHALGDDDDARAAVAARLDELEASGLVWRV